MCVIASVCVCRCVWLCVCLICDCAFYSCIRITQITVCNINVYSHSICCLCLSHILNNIFFSCFSSVLLSFVRSYVFVVVYVVVVVAISFLALARSLALARFLCSFCLFLFHGHTLARLGAQCGVCLFRIVSFGTVLTSSRPKSPVETIFDTIFTNITVLSSVSTISILMFSFSFFEQNEYLPIR